MWTDHAAAAAVIARTAYEKSGRLIRCLEGKIRMINGEIAVFGRRSAMELWGTDYSDVELSMVGKTSGRKPEDSACR